MRTDEAITSAGEANDAETASGGAQEAATAWAKRVLKQPP
jgi:hypothetical protein